MKSEKPRVRFCYECGKKLWGNHYAERKLPYMTENVILHKKCAKEWDDELNDHYRGY